MQIRTRFLLSFLLILLIFGLATPWHCSKEVARGVSRDCSWQRLEFRASGALELCLFRGGLSTTGFLMEARRRAVRGEIVVVSRKSGETASRLGSLELAPLCCF